MTTKIALSSLKPLFFGALTLLCSHGLVGCSPPVETSPVVTITIPSNMQVLPAGQPIDVRFTVSGIDATGTSMAPFTLVGGDMRIAGQGQARAFLSSGNFIARTVSIPNDGSPFLIPDPQYGTAANLVTPGMKKITLHLYYNDGSDVSPQREGVVNVVVQ